MIACPRQGCRTQIVQQSNVMSRRKLSNDSLYLSPCYLHNTQASVHGRTWVIDYSIYLFFYGPVIILWFALLMLCESHTMKLMNNVSWSHHLFLVSALIHEFHETCHSVTFIVLVNSHQRWKQTRNRVCFHLWCELTLALWCHSVVWSQFSWNKM